jgi:sodium transport system permease protein
MILCMAPAYLSFLPGVEVDHLWSLVPIANIVLLSRELLLGNYAWTYFALTMGTMTSLALWLLSRTVGFFGNEAMLGAADAGPRFSWRNMFSRDRGGGRHPGEFSSGLLVQVFLLVLIGFFYVGTPLQLQNLKLGLVLTQVLIIAGIPLVALRVMRIPVRSTLGLDRLPRPSILFFSLLLAPAATLVAALVAMGQGLFLEVPDSYREMMEKLFRLEGGGGLLVAILVFAVTPAVCEEILFRGFVLRGLARRMAPAQAILWTAVLFGAFHFDMYRILPTAVLGGILGLLVWLTGSLWPAILLHATNNSIAVLANDPRVAERIPWLAEGSEIPWPVVGLVAAVGTIALVALVHRRDRSGFGAPEEKPEPVAQPDPWEDQKPAGS